MIVRTDVEQNEQDTIDVLKIVYLSIVPAVPLKCLEEAVFSEFCEKTSNHFCALLESISLTLQELLQQVYEIQPDILSTALQHCSDLLDFVDACVEYLLSCSEHFSLNNLHSLSHCILALIELSYAHCKESNNLYGELFGFVSDNLSSLFKKTHSLQTNFIRLLEKLDPARQSEQDGEDFSHIIQKLCLICEIAARLDVKVVVALWKVISRICCHHKELLLQQLDISLVLKTLCGALSSSCSYFSQLDAASFQNDNKESLQLVKVAGFQMRILVTLTKEYDGYLGGSVETIYQLIVTFKSLLPPSLPSKKLVDGIGGELTKHVGVGLEPLIAHLMSNKDFVRCLTAVHQDSDSAFPRLSTIMTVLQLLPNQSDDVLKEWLVPVVYSEDQPRCSILQSVFSCLPQTYLEVCIPVYLPGGGANFRNNGDVSLYEHVLIGLCTFVATLSATYFSYLEETLLENVLGPCFHRAMLAIDVWCFLARYGSATLCRDQCHFLITLLNQATITSSPECGHLVLLIRRLTRLLAPEHQAMLLTSNTSSNVLRALPLAAFTKSLVQQSCGVHFETCCGVLTDWCSLKQPTVADANRLLTAVGCLCNICSTSKTHDASTKMNDVLSSLLSTLSSRHGNVSSRLFHQIVAGILQLASCLHPSLDNRTTYQVLNFIDSLTSTKDLDDSVKLSALVLFKSMSSKRFPASSEQVGILRLLSKLFERFLSDDRPVVHQMALETFSYFAEHTVHESVIPDSLNANPKTRETTIAYLNKIACSGRDSRVTTNSGGQEIGVNIEILKTQMQIVGAYWQRSTTASCEAEVCIEQSMDVTEDCASFEIDCPIDVEEAEDHTVLKALLQKMDTCVTTLHVLHKDRPLPDWAKHRITDVTSQLSTLML